MVTILSVDDARDIKGWILAADVYDALRQAESIGEHALAAQLYRMDNPSGPAPGRYELSVGLVTPAGERKFVMLVS